ncbi:hypothetical protein SAMN04488500_12632 [Sporomusa malonica]|uniref:Uncharacterized protein n=1 Tax=Sporomusa malonica TaxID=112901 RepID=A0A1W2ELE2_9FIRM|nr:hypothetical protein SAMN04488500_12632 [Sporomusa malonica]
MVWPSAFMEGQAIFFAHFWDTRYVKFLLFREKRTIYVGREKPSH